MAALRTTTTTNGNGNGNGSLLATLSRLGRDRHPHSDTAAVTAPEEPDRVPMLQRGVTLTFVNRIVRELEALGRGDVDCGQLLNGVHTTSSATDWREFDRSRDAFCLKACCLHTGLSFVETCIQAGLTHDPDTGEAYFGEIKTFVSYTWRSDPSGPKTITVRNLKVAVEDTPGVATDAICATYIELLRLQSSDIVAALMNATDSLLRTLQVAQLSQPSFVSDGAALRQFVILLLNPLLLAYWIRRHQVDIIHARSRCLAISALIVRWLMPRRVLVVVTWHGLYSSGSWWRRALTSSTSMDCKRMRCPC